ncbi:MAG: c-type cytochrome [Dehalogenimonas sp.]
MRPLGKQPSLFIRGLAVVSAVSLLIVFSGCGSTPSATTTTKLTTTTVAVTFGQLAQSGQVLYQSKCAVCHGDNGQGVRAPALWGSNSHLSDLGNAQLLLNYTTSAMPPGSASSLSRQNHIDIICYLLIQSNAVTGNSTFNEAQLSSILLK